MWGEGWGKSPYLPRGFTVDLKRLLKTSITYSKEKKELLSNPGSSGDQLCYGHNFLIGKTR